MHADYGCQETAADAGKRRTITTGQGLLWEVCDIALPPCGHWVRIPGQMGPHYSGRTTTALISTISPGTPPNAEAPIAVQAG